MQARFCEAVFWDKDSQKPRLIFFEIRRGLGLGAKIQIQQIQISCLFLLFREDHLFIGGPSSAFASDFFR